MLPQCCLHVSMDMSEKSFTPNTLPMYFFRCFVKLIISAYFKMNVSYNNLFLIKRLYLIRRARLICTLLPSTGPRASHSTEPHTLHDESIVKTVFLIQGESQCYSHSNDLLTAAFLSGFWDGTQTCLWISLITQISSYTFYCSQSVSVGGAGGENTQADRFTFCTALVSHERPLYLFSYYAGWMASVIYSPCLAFVLASLNLKKTRRIREVKA